MAITYASKASSKVDDRFKLKSFTEAAINKDYEWSGVNTVNVYSLPTTALSDYTLTGTSRYGTPVEQQTEVQTMVVTKDRSFAITVDKKTMQDTPIATIAGKVLANQTDEVIIPEVDAYRLAAMATAAVANSAVDTAAITASNAYSALLAGNEKMGNAKVPAQGRIMFCTYSYYNFLKQDAAFIKNSDLGQKMIINGQVGEADGVKIVPVPSSYLPANTAFIMCHPCATVGVTKLEDYTTHNNPPGVSGALIEGRERYDAFVLNNKVDALYTHKIA